jgi:glycosyltransferase involved in cell wall biosynthesis
MKFIRTLIVTNPNIKIDKYDLDVFYQLDTLFPVRSKSTPIVTIIYDLIPLIYKKQYMSIKLHNKRISGVVSLYRQVARNLLFKKSIHTHKRSDAVISISDRTKEDLSRMYDVNIVRIHTVLLGADKIEKAIQNLEMEKQVLNFLKKPYVLYVGGSDTRKGLINFLDDFYQIQKLHNLCLIIAGKELTDDRVIESRNIKAKIKKLKLSNAVLLPGFVSDSELQYLYAHAEAFVFPSRYEGFGLPILEAMQAKCPVVCYDNSSLPEVAGDAALMVPDGESMVYAITQLLEDESLRKSLIKKGLAQAKKFTWEKTAKETLEILIETAKTKAKK